MSANTGKFGTASQLDAALRRQKALADFSLCALRERDPARVIDRAAALVAEVLEVDFGTVLELEPDGKALRVVAGHNWPPHRLGARVGAGPDTQAGHALELYRQSGANALEAPRPVAIEDLAADGRFANTFRVREFGVVSAVCVVIPARERPFGTLTAHSRTRRRFEPFETEFMQAVANVLSAALERCRAHTALRESEARFRSLGAQSSDWYWEQDAELRFSSVSTEFFRKSGMRREDVLGKRRWELSGVSPLGARWEAHRAALEKRLPFRNFEFRRTGAEGTAHYQSISGEPIFDAEGRFTGYRGTGLDITERRRAEQELRARAESDRALIELGLLGLREQNAGALLERTVQIVARALEVELVKVLKLLPDGSGLRLVAGVGWNPGTVGRAVVDAGLGSQAGYAIREHELAEQRLGAGFAPVIVTDLSTEERFSGPTLLAEHGVVSGVAVVIPGNERTWGVLGAHSRAPRCFERREAEFLQAAANLLSAALERCRAHAALRENRRLLARAQEIAGLGYWEYDLALGVARGSRGLRRMLGVPSDLPPQTPQWSLDMILPEDRERVLAVMKHSIEEGSSYELETRVATQGGAQRIMFIAGEAVKNDAGRVTKLIGTCLDVTEQRRREDALCDAADQLQALSRRLVEVQETERRRLAADLHDRVGQNLTALGINLDILASRMNARDADAAHRLRDSLALLDQTALCIEGVLDDLRPPMLDDLGLGPAMRWVAEEFTKRTVIPTRLQVQGTERRTGRLNEIALLRIVQEALNNVAKHARASEVTITLSWQSDGVRVEVADDGAGIGRDGSPGRRGFGLITMRERIQAAGGLLDVQSVPGKGTRVRALVPG
ncbi:MAG: GAF domain-containing protein [Betaproteobacteria bacterium]|nr:MAG: GAF domain-containing protein [Betaproteobacteria bacterium]